LFKNIILEKKEGVARITINRPEARNALDIETRKELLAALDDVERDESVRVVVITGAGEKTFVSGADIKMLSEMDFRQIMEFSESPLGGQTLYKRIEEFSKPVIAAINGLCLGGGLELAMACDIRIAAENAKFGQPEVNLGIMPGAGGTQRLPRLVGPGMAKLLCFTGDIIDAKEAERIGLVERVVPLEKLEEETMKIAKTLASKSPLTLRLIKRAINMAMNTPLDAGLRFESHALGICFASEDKAEGMRAFLEKRKPEFRGR